MKIWKFLLGEVVTTEVIDVIMPKGAEIVHIAVQRDVPCLWAMANPKADAEQRSFYLAATGEELPDGRYLGTVFQCEGAYVWHVLEVTDES